MPLTIQDTSTVPNPDGWKYYVKETNFTVTSRNYSIFYQEVVKHCQANGVAPPTEQEVTNQMCDKLHIPCYESESTTIYMNAFAMGLPLPPRVGGCCGR